MAALPHEDVFNPRQWVPIREGILVEPPEVNDPPPLAALLGDGECGGAPGAHPLFHKLLLNPKVRDLGHRVPPFPRKVDRPLLLGHRTRPQIHSGIANFRAAPDRGVGTDFLPQDFVIKLLVQGVPQLLHIFTLHGALSHHSSTHAGHSSTLARE